jgi:proteasome accessory factor B
VDKLERLLTLLMTLLHTNRPLSAAELADKVPGYPPLDQLATFRRAFERDKESLREMGVPLVVAEIPGSDPPLEGYRVRPEDYYLRDPGLDRDELAALHLAASAVRMEGVGGVEGLWKLGGVVRDDEAPGAGDGLVRIPGGPALAVLFEALHERRLVTFSYKGQDRQVDPQRLDFQSGRWYLRGHDRSRDAERSFRVDRIEGEVVASAPGTAAPVPDGAVPGVPDQPWQLAVEEPLTARVRIDAAQAPWALQHLGPGSVTETGPDGSVVVTLEVTNREGFRSFVLTFLEHAEVLDPPELRDDLLAWLELVP